MGASLRTDSLEILIGDLIFKLGKANQQIHAITQRVAQLEVLLQNHPSESFSFSQNQAYEKEPVAQ